MFDGEKIFAMKKKWKQNLRIEKIFFFYRRNTYRRKKNVIKNCQKKPPEMEGKTTRNGRKKHQK